ncbi:PTH11-like integral membrane protein [Cordyceps javanica]|uniref:PTH11-like integral membrane protein n=1 Tax=Cordyceps javanica TaxID=43265 RepID=A0A545ULV4_9HYPO|nr:PTH11-like integral membrane protein [Cordyceps javanica]TQW01949.1 PTH11-like integral membrane protein [Cordyceps javanica]
MPSPQRELVTDRNKSPLIQILAWMFLVIAVLSCIARSGTKLYMVKRLKTEDWYAIVATIAACGQYIALVAGGYQGLGKHAADLKPDKVNGALQGQYAADILFIASLFCAKIATAMMTTTISQRSHKRMIQAVELLIALWAASGLFVVFFQCQLPNPWYYVERKCIQRVAFWSYFSVLNIATDLLLIAIMVENVRRIQTSWSKKTLVICVFGSRIFVTPAVVAQIIFLKRSFSTTDPTFDTWELTIITAVVSCISILAVCVPNLKPFLDSLESGQIRVDDLRRQGKSSSGGYPSYNRNGYGGHGSGGGGRSHHHHHHHHQAAGGGSSSQSSRRDPLASKASQRSKVFEMVDMHKTKRQESQPPPPPQPSPGEGDTAWDGQSHTSQTILIQQTKTWYVDVEERRESHQG